MSSLSSSNSPPQRQNHSIATFLALEVKLLVIEFQVHQQTWTQFLEGSGSPLIKWV